MLNKSLCYKQIDPKVQESAEETTDSSTIVGFLTGNIEGKKEEEEKVEVPRDVKVMPILLSLTSKQVSSKFNLYVDGKHLLMVKGFLQKKIEFQRKMSNVEQLRKYGAE